MNNFQNIVILVSDSLRYDSVPKEISENPIPTLAPSLHTPTSFASFFTARSPDNHNVKNFIEDLNPDLPTAAEYFENFSFYDGLSSSINKHIFRSEPQELDDMKPPFLWIERAMDTHLPYGIIGHERDADFEISGQEYIKKGKKGEIDLEEEYDRGAKSLEKHFFRHIDELENHGIMEDTLVILTSDHGELLGENFLGRRRYDHNYPPMRELVEVPTVFWNAEVEADCMRLIDVLPTALEIVGKNGYFGDGVDIRHNQVEEGINIMEDIKGNFRTQWRFQGNQWRPTGKSKVDIATKTLWGDLKKTVYRKGYRPIEKRIEEKKESEEELGGIDI